MEEILKNIEGNLLLISNDEKLMNIVSTNKNITESYVLSNSGSKGKKLSFKNKKIHIKKLKKYFNKKKVDNLVVDYNLIKNYLYSFIKSSVYINNKNLYFYNVENKENLIKQYQRYGANIENKKVLKIDNSNTKSNFFKDNYFIFIDKKDKLTDSITDLLTS